MEGSFRNKYCPVNLLEPNHCVVKHSGVLDTVKKEGLNAAKGSMGSFVSDSCFIALFLILFSGYLNSL